MPAQRKKPARRRTRHSSRKHQRFLAFLLLVLMVGVFVYLEPKTDRRETLKETPASESDLRDYAYAGLPETTEALTLITNPAFMVGYSEERRNPLWVAYRVSGKAEYPSLERPGSFRTDERTAARVETGDFTGSGYDRGHLAPNYVIVTRYGREAQEETFLLSNISPQRPRLNRNLWRRLEEKIANDYAPEFETLWVITGPVFDERIELLDSGVEVPDAFYKIVVDEVSTGPRIIAFLVPQNVEGNEPLERYLVSVDRIEAETGLEFLSDLEDVQEDYLEREPVSRLW